MLRTVWKFLSSPVGLYVLLGGAVLYAGWHGYGAVYDRGVAACEGERDLADLHAQEEAHQFLLAEQARGDAISAELSKTQRRLDATKTEYLAYANSIRGHCPADLGLFLATETLTPPSVPATPGEPANPAPPVAASAIAGNIAANRYRFELNRAACTALVNWHTGQEALNGN
jgi:hypothetical protein